MSWIEIAVIILTSAYLLSMLALYIYRKRHYLPIDPCADAPGPRLVQQFYKAKRKEKRLQRKRGASNGN